MELRPAAPPRRRATAAALAALACLAAPAAAHAQNAYITNSGSDTVSVIDTATNTMVGSPIAVGDAPFGVAVTPDGSRVYVANFSGDTVSVIDTATNTVLRPPDRGRRFPLRRGGHAGRQQGLCRQLRQRHRVGDRHGDQHRDRPPDRGRQ